MLDLVTLRWVSGFLFVGMLAGGYLFGRSRHGKEGTTYEVAAIVHVPRVLHGIWVLAAVVLPLTAFLLGAFLPDVVYGTWANVSFPGDTFVQLMGLGLYAAGALLAVFSAANLGRFMVIDIAVSKDHEMVTTGPYARVRHPTYTAVLLLGLSAVFVLLNLLFLLSFLLAVALATYRARLEERLLSSEEGFGRRYREYMEVTGRFLPRLTGSNRVE
jgi:protein-S-isoprenylcysteine O-methyltransferase Ste14